jgi:hypothetical protein
MSAGSVIPIRPFIMRLARARKAAAQWKNGTALAKSVAEAKRRGWPVFTDIEYGVAAHIMATEFTGLELLSLRPVVQGEVVLGVNGAPELLLRYGLITPEMLPQRKKRVMYPDCAWVDLVRRTRHGQLAVSLRLCGALPADSPLNRFTAKSLRDAAHEAAFPCFGAKRAHYQKLLGEDLSRLGSMVRLSANVSQVPLGEHGFKIHDADGAALAALIDRFEQEVAALAACVRVEPVSRTALAVVRP